MSAASRSGHDLVKLAARCASADPFYTQPDTTGLLERVVEWGTATRYPWVETQHYIKSGEDLRVIELFVRQIRGIDLPLVRDDYMLAMIVRGRHQLPPKTPPFEREPWLTTRRRQLTTLEGDVTAPRTPASLTGA